MLDSLRVGDLSTAPSVEQISEALRPALPAGFHAVLFGSRAAGRAGRSSDWDVGILGPRPLDGAVVATLREALEAIPTLHSFDLVDLATVPDDFREIALRAAVTLA
jgi:predicted nucleotidyltransferase